MRLFPKSRARSMLSAFRNPPAAGSTAIFASASRVPVFTRHRDDADLRFLNGSEGTTLIEVATSQVVGTAVTRANIITPVAGAQSSSAHPWSVLTPAQKMGQLRDLVIREVERLVPEVLGAKP